MRTIRLFIISHDGVKNVGREINKFISIKKSIYCCNVYGLTAEGKPKSVLRNCAYSSFILNPQKNQSVSNLDKIFIRKKSDLFLLHRFRNASCTLTRICTVWNFAGLTDPNRLMAGNSFWSNVRLCTERGLNAFFEATNFWKNNEEAKKHILTVLNFYRKTSGNEHRVTQLVQKRFSLRDSTQCYTM